MKAYQLRFYPTSRQRKQLAKEFNACWYVWNWALRTRSDAYKACKESLTVRRMGIKACGLADKPEACLV
ncbi:hypothetical protein TAO_0746 [Candidatus Nitrosoglobus terrae]|uniref:Transposase putative helix-turn-helix domain-containing protein n=1 Tax=Candidatus Nitrosoglobus terrae TaxID=1630141 RepID=A0A1Q2SLU8_9GAMM|nr:helix-turn-helix domain-containing protein [Candidatus Nitrosoglobus terrae]BAW80116.1 hypothetical protein TAO_0746 [Candidatus Nitrosoglobus terrae]